MVYSLTILMLITPQITEDGIYSKRTLKLDYNNGRLTKYEIQ